MDYQDLVAQVEPKWQDDFRRFVEGVEDSSPEFDERLDADTALQRLVEEAIERKVSSRNMRKVFWDDVERANAAFARTLEQAISERLAAPRPIESATVEASMSPAQEVGALQRELAELAATVQIASADVSPARRGAAVLESSAVAERVQSLASMVARLTMQRTRSSVGR